MNGWERDGLESSVRTEHLHSSCRWISQWEVMKISSPLKVVGWFNFVCVHTYHANDAITAAVKYRFLAFRIFVSVLRIALPSSAWHVSVKWNKNSLRGISNSNKYVPYIDILHTFERQTAGYTNILLRMEDDGGCEGAHTQCAMKGSVSYMRRWGLFFFHSKEDAFCLSNANEILKRLSLICGEIRWTRKFRWKRVWCLKIEKCSRYNSSKSHEFTFGKLNDWMKWSQANGEIFSIYVRNVRRFTHRPTCMRLCLLSDVYFIRPTTHSDCNVHIFT